ncbi:MAG: PriCT-2 domain-containing protein [Gammaproteobacteria bacterium]
MTLKDKRPPVGVGAGNAAFGKAAKSRADYTTVQAALFCVSAGDRDTWLRMAMAVKSELGDGGFDLWDEWSQTADNYDPKTARATWRSITPNGDVTIGTLYHEAQQHGFRFNGETRPQPPTAEEIAERDRRKQENEGVRQRGHEDAAKKAVAILALCRELSRALREQARMLNNISDTDGTALLESAPQRCAGPLPSRCRGSMISP